MVKNIIDERIALSKQNIQKVVSQDESLKAMQDESTRYNAQQNRPDAFEEIRKFKQLLDDGIISEEDFNIKKKQLLGL